MAPQNEWPLIVPLAHQLLQDWKLRPWRPHRTFASEPQPDLATRIRQIKSAARDHFLVDTQTASDYARSLAVGWVRQFELAPDGVIAEALASAIRKLIGESPALWFVPSLNDMDGLSFDARTSYRALLEGRAAFLSEPDQYLSQWRERALMTLCGPIVLLPDSIRRAANDAATPSVTAPLISFVPDPADALDEILVEWVEGAGVPEGLFSMTRNQLLANLYEQSGVNLDEPLPKNLKIVLPSMVRDAEPESLAHRYLADTPIGDLLMTRINAPLSDGLRFEHTHIIGGTGHGKTQLMQQFIAHDLPRALAGDCTVIVIDSQGDLIRTIRQLAGFALSERHSPIAIGDLVHVRIGDFDMFRDPVRVREVVDGYVFVEGSDTGVPAADVRHADEVARHCPLVLIDPEDVEYPVALNLFDVNMERINRYAQLDRERMINSVIELYDFVFGGLLGAELTSKQATLFRYVTRLMLHIPDATIHTLRRLMEPDGYARFREHIDKLQGTARAFFETEFQGREFAQTRQQVLRRLWGVLENQTFERMFSHPRNKLDLFAEMNAGKVILINTSKDLLKQSGTEVLGRFFIAMIAQAAQERATIPTHKRKPTFVYIDEAADYFDQNVELVLREARKYKVGVTLAHQYLGQLNAQLQQAIAANTSIKLAGGVSDRDARALAGDMRCSPQTVLSQPKGCFATFAKGLTPQAMPFRVDFGRMERMDRMTNAQVSAMRDHMRRRYAVHFSAIEQALTEEQEPAQAGADDEMHTRPSADW